MAIVTLAGGQPGVVEPMYTVTIVARNFLPRAKVLARTYRQHNPDDEVGILVVDAEPGELSDGPDHRIYTPADLSLPRPEFERMALIYNVTELCTALKPWALELLLDRGAAVATYLDPDIAVYDSLAQIEKLSLEHGIVLTPHTVEPIPRDGLAPTEAHIMAAGTFNLGFLAVGDGDASRDMLSWWQQRLLRDCISAPRDMLFVDQRWIDLVPGYFPHTVLTDPTYNVAYWNLDSRPLVRTGDRVHVADGGPLRFFHFSGYEPDRPWVLAKYHVERPRVVLSEHPVVQELCEEYAEWITDPAVGGRPGRAIVDVPYRFDRLPDGLRVTPAMRAALRRAMVVSDHSGDAHPPGWGDHEAVRDWFRSPLLTGCRTNRYLYAVWESRPDVRAAFAAPLGGDSEALVDWAWRSSLSDPFIVTELVPPVEAQVRPGPSDVDGVNLAGYFTAEMGVGEMGRMLVDGARAAGLACSTVLNTSTLSRRHQEFTDSADQTRYPVTIAAVNADELPRWARESDPGLRLGHTIGMWAWEVEEFAGYDEALGLVDEVWTLSEFSRDAIARATDKPVHVIPLPTREPAPAGELDREALGLSDRPYLLFAFDYLSVFERKNPLGLVTAFDRAFPEGDGPVLVLKSINGNLCRSDRERLRMAVADRSDVVLIEEYLDRAQLGALMEGCAAYVSLHRAEGYGLTMAEAMARGRPVVATAYSGNLDFMTDTNSLLVPHALVPVQMGSGPYPVSTVWAEPDLGVAAELLRWVVEHPDEAAALGRAAALSVRETGSMARTAQFIRTRVEEALVGIREVPAPAEPRTSRAERAIKSARRAVKAPADRRRTAFLAGYDERQRGRFLAVLHALGSVRRRTDRALRVAQENRRELRRIGAQVENLAGLTSSSQATAALAVRLGEELKLLHERLLVEAQVTAETGAHLRAVDTRLTGMAEDLGRLGDYVRVFSGDVETSLEEVRRQLAELSTADPAAVIHALLRDVQRLDAEQAARPYSSDGTGLRRSDETGARYLGFTESSEVPAFSDLFRGSEEFLVERMRAYMPLLADRGPVLDVGCGRGELLRLLAEAGVPARGVDHDEAAVARALAHGVDASVGDAVAAVTGAQPGSVGAVISTQVVEHLSGDELRALLLAGQRALRPGGLLIAETVNPHSPAALKTFWLDLTHVRPLYPEALLLLARDCGYRSARIVFPFGTGDLDTDLRTCGEYALVAAR